MACRTILTGAGKLAKWKGAEAEGNSLCLFQKCFWELLTSVNAHGSGFKPCPRGEISLDKTKYPSAFLADIVHIFQKE